MRLMFRHRCKKAGSSPENCGTCGGAGKVRQQQGFFTLERTRPHVVVKVRLYQILVIAVQAAGRVDKEQNLAVTIPAGVDTGTQEPPIW